MNILFANYGDFSTNSLNHIGPFANYLSEQGHHCIVAIPRNRESIAHLETVLFQPATYDDVLSIPNHFPNSKPADIIHAWTPRGTVLDFVDKYIGKFPCKVVIHLEDNERALIESYYRQPFEKLRNLELPDEFPDWNPSLSHPLKHTAFLALADGVTAVTESLLDFSFPDRPAIELLPGLPPQTYPSAAEKASVRASLGIAADEKIVVFPGSVTSSNREDVRSLYLAVKLLRERGHRIRLIKTGPNVERFKKSFGFDLSETVLDLGIVNKSLIPQLLSMASVLVQPGKADELNRYRLPSKLPEFLDSGAPVVTAATNIGHRLLENTHCRFITDSSPAEIADACEAILNDPELAQTLGKNGQAFAREQFNIASQSDKLLAFYQSVVAQDSGNWKETAPHRSTFADSLPLRLGNLAASQSLSHHWRAAHQSRLDDLAKTVAILNQEDRERIASLRSRLESAVASEQSSLQKSRLQADELLTQLKNAHHAAQAEADSLRTALDNANQRADQLAESLQHLKSTASWKLTMPLRALRRTFFDSKDAPQTDDTEFPSEIPAPKETPAEPQTETPPPSESPAFRDYPAYCEMLAPLVEQYKENFLKRLDALERKPLISIILPVYDVPEKWLRLAIASVQNQIYPNWELCIADDASPEPHVKTVLEELAASDDRIKVAFRATNGHISDASNSALELASGDFIALLDHDDELPTHALARIVDQINKTPNALLIYSDEDKIDEQGYRSQPHFKSDWNPDLLLGQNYISHLGVYRTETVRSVGGFRKGFEGAQDWDLALRVSEKCQAGQIQHIPEVLYHWRAISGSTATDIDEKNYAHQAGGQAIKSHLDRKGISAHLSPIDRFYWRVHYQLPQPLPLVSIVIPTRDRADLLEACIASIQEKTTYAYFEIVVADNDSQDTNTLRLFERLEEAGVRIVPCPGPFNYSAIVNKAVAAARGTIICTLNNDTTIIEPTWLEEMVSHASRLAIGTVGAKLLYPHDHLQHAGIVLGLGGIASEAFKKIHVSDDGYIHRACLVSGYSAVTGACMTFRKAVWSELGGFNETDTPNAYSDVDFCLRASQKGYRTLFTPFASLYHHESASRGPETNPEKQAAFEKAYRFMESTWADEIAADPFYNRNLTLRREDFSFCEYPRDYPTD